MYSHELERNHGILVRPGVHRESARITVDGGKHSFAHTLAAAALAESAQIDGVPATLDTYVLVATLRELFAEVTYMPQTGSLRFGQPLSPRAVALSEQLTASSRSLYVLLPALVHWAGEVRLPTGPQGCRIGDRPSDWYFSLLAQFGVKVAEEDGHMSLRWDVRRPAQVSFTQPSMTGSVMAMAMAVATPGASEIRNTTHEPTFNETIACARMLGAQVRSVDDSLVITSIASAGVVSARILPDRIHAVTYLAAGLLAGQRIVVRGDGPLRIPHFISFLRQIGCSVDSTSNSVVASVPPGGALRRARLVGGSEPRFSSDWLPFASLLLSLRARGTSSITDLVFVRRLQFLELLKGSRMPQVSLQPSHKRSASATLEARVHAGPDARLSGGRRIAPPDIRGSAALVIAALSADRPTLILDDFHLRRGYADMPRDLRTLGFAVSRVPIGETRD